MTTNVWRRSMLGIDPDQRAWAKARIRELDLRLTALLTPAEANRAQRVVRNTGRRRGG